VRFQSDEERLDTFDPCFQPPTSSFYRCWFPDEEAGGHRSAGRNLSRCVHYSVMFDDAGHGMILMSNSDNAEGIFQVLKSS
jgi:hypothetical protein